MTTTDYDGLWWTTSPLTGYRVGDPQDLREKPAISASLVVSSWFSAIRWCQEKACLLVCQASVKQTIKIVSLQVCSMVFGSLMCWSASSSQVDIEPTKAAAGRQALYPDVRSHFFKTELFIWLAWSIPTATLLAGVKVGELHQGHFNANQHGNVPLGPLPSLYCWSAERTWTGLSMAMW